MLACIATGLGTAAMGARAGASAVGMGAIALLSYAAGCSAGAAMW